MAHRHQRTKPELRFIVVDDETYAWAVLDRNTGKKVRAGIKDPFEANLLADNCNENPPEDHQEE